MRDLKGNLTWRSDERALLVRTTTPSLMAPATFDYVAPKTLHVSKRDTDDKFGPFWGFVSDAGAR